MTILLIICLAVMAGDEQNMRWVWDNWRLVVFLMILSSFIEGFVFAAARGLL